MASKNTVVFHRIEIKADEELGTWQGLGGAVTEATAYNFMKLGVKKRQKLIEAYYAKTGLDYQWGRISVGSNDYCLSPFEYTEKPDLSDFTIEHDKQWVIPLLKEILNNKSLKFVASPWSPPNCLKLRNVFGSILAPWHYKTFARYIRKWLFSYSKAGIKIDYITPQNEPHANQIWESCYYTYRSQKRLAYKYLAPALSDFKTQILLWDHNKSTLLEAADSLLAGKYVDFGSNKIAGICFHWYDGFFPDEMWRVRQKYHDILMISSEMCCGFSPYDKEKWQKDARLYLNELFYDINSGVSAFIDWNMLLDYSGGPNYAANYTKSPVILNEAGDDYILTPIYDALKKFARLFPTGSEVVRCEYDSDDFVAIVRKVEKGYRVVAANLSDKDLRVSIKLGDKEKDFVLSKSEMSSILI